MTYRIELTGAAKRALTDVLPEAVAVACWEFIRGPLAENPHLVGKALRGQLEGDTRRGGANFGLSTKFLTTESWCASSASHIAVTFIGNAI